MKVYRMTFDIAVEDCAPDVYTLEREIRKAIRDRVASAIGAEGVKQNVMRVNGIDASAAIDRQIKEDTPISIRPCQIVASKVINESEA